MSFLPWTGEWPVHLMYVYGIIAPPAFLLSLHFSVTPLCIPQGGVLGAGVSLYLLSLSYLLPSSVHPFIPVTVPLLFDRVLIHMLFIWLTAPNHLTSGGNYSFQKFHHLHFILGALWRHLGNAALVILFFLPVKHCISQGSLLERCRPKRETWRASESHFAHSQKINEAGYSTLVYGFYGGP